MKHIYEVFPYREDLLEASEEVVIEGDISWYVTHLPDGTWVAWDEANPAGAQTFATRAQAIRHQREGFEVALEQGTVSEEDWVGLR